MTDVDLKPELLNSLKIIIKYQNSILLKKIAEENNWNLEELKKKFLKEKIKKEEIMNSYKGSELTSKCKELNKNTNSIEKNEYKINKKKVKIKIKKKRQEKCYKFEFLKKIYFINPKNNYAYDEKGEFIGVKENDIINFDMEEVDK